MQDLATYDIVELELVLSMDELASDPFAPILLLVQTVLARLFTETSRVLGNCFRQN